jgi:hypothetical protein
MLSFVLLSDQFIQLITPVSEASYTTDDTSTLPNTCPICPSSTIPSASQHGQAKRLVDREASKLYQCKKPAGQAQTVETESSTDTGHNAIMPKGSSNLTWLPPIILALQSQYFTTLLNALCASEKPFDDFQKFSPMFLRNSRTAFKHIWPHLKIRVETDNVLFSIVSLLSQISFMVLII